MADEGHPKSHECETTTPAPTAVEEAGVEIKDRGLSDFMRKNKDEDRKLHEEVIVTEFEEKVQVSEPKEEEGKKEKKESLLEKLHRSGSSSSSSSDEEEGEGKEKKKKKKGLKEKIKEKISSSEEEKKHHDDEETAVPVVKHDVEVEVEVVHAEEPSEEKKGLLEKIKEKLPGGQHKKTEDHADPPPPPVECASAEEAAYSHSHEGEAKEKKGFLEKIKEKLPGYHPKTEEEKGEGKGE